MIKTRFWNSLSARILLFSLIFLLALPWLGYRYLNEAKVFLFEGQQEAQLLAAKAVATVLSVRADLFSANNTRFDPAKTDHALYVYPLDHAIKVDGYSGDWGELLSQEKIYTDESIVYDRTQGAVPAPAFSFILGEYGSYLYGHLKVTDAHVVYRHQQYIRLDNSDHIRLSYRDTQNNLVRLLLTTFSPGQVSIYQMKANWKTPLTGQPLYKVTAVWQETSDGYILEFRMPLKLLSADKQFSLQVANVTSPDERQIDNIIATIPKLPDHQINPLLTRSHELDRILTGLEQHDVRICVVDRYRRIRSVIGNQDLGSNLCQQTDVISNELVSHALQGGSNVYQRQTDAGNQLFIAAQPIRNNDGSILGAVLLAKNASSILKSQRNSLFNILTATLLVTGAAILLLVLFGSWLAFRLRRLKNEIAAAIDPHGRVIQHRIQADNHSGDEIGELSRSFSELLSRLHNYTGFIESVPRMLRHEILNPVNTIGLALQNLQKNEHTDTRAMKMAWSAIQQLELIVQSLTEAAHVDDSLTEDHCEVFDLAAMLDEYVNNSQLKHPQYRLVYQGQAASINIQGSDLRIAQLLDKLTDNAVDFSEAGVGQVVFDLEVTGKKAMLSICNDGPLIPEDILATLCLGITSRRPSSNDSLHLGIGLFVAARIAQHHAGKLTIKNRKDGQGVCVQVELPIFNA